MRSTVQRGNGGWVISFTVERSPKSRRARRPRAAVGVDLGLTRLATLSTRAQVANPRPLEPALAELRRLQRRLDRQRRANNPANYETDAGIKAGPRIWVHSRRMRCTQRRIATLHRRVANLRRNHAHELTTALTREFGVIGVETLSVKTLQGNRRLARRIGDAGWGLILAQLKYKASWSDGSILVAADRFYPSSKTCSVCGAVKTKLSLAERVFICERPSCGHIQDRDVNAAANLAHMACAHAEAEGTVSYVARIGRFTPAARGGRIRLIAPDQHRPVKREGPTGPSLRREARAAA